MANEGRTVFEAKGLEKNYEEGHVHALRGVNFQIAAGEFVIVIGKSGSGKTTLLQLLGALDHSTGGSLSYRGRLMGELLDASRYRAREVGFIFQAFHLLPTFTALENVQMPMFETNRKATARRSRAMELLKAVGLERRASHFPSELSGGERQRVAIARSLANDPPVLLADEPTGNLDSESAQQILELITKIREERKLTLVLVTHDLGLARRAPRVLEMKDGHIVFDGPPERLPGEI